MKPVISKYVNPDRYISQLKKKIAYLENKTEKEMFGYGNSYGNEFTIQLKEAVNGEQLMRIKIGDCCVYMCDLVIPVSYFTNRVGKLFCEDVAGLRNKIEWGGDYKKVIASNIRNYSEYVDTFSDVKWELND